MKVKIEKINKNLYKVSTKRSWWAPYIFKSYEHSIDDARYVAKILKEPVTEVI